jgi:hypothetical protein
MKNDKLFLLLLYFSVSYCIAQTDETPQWKAFPFRKQTKFCVDDTTKRLTSTEFFHGDKRALVRSESLSDKSHSYSEYKYNQAGRIINESNYSISNGDTSMFSFYNYSYDDSMRLINKEWGNKTGIRTKIVFEYLGGHVIKELYYYVDKDSVTYRAANNYSYKNNHIVKCIHQAFKPQPSSFTVVYDYVDTMLTSKKTFGSRENL